MFSGLIERGSLAQERQHTPMRLPTQIETHPDPCETDQKVPEIRDTTMLCQRCPSDESVSKMFHSPSLQAEYTGVGVSNVNRITTRDRMVVQLMELLHGWVRRSVSVKLVQRHRTPVGTPRILLRGSENACGHARVNERFRHGCRVSNTDIWLFEDVDQIKSAIDNASSMLPPENRTFTSGPTTFHLQRTRNFSACLDNDCNLRTNAALLGLPVTSGC